jgi:hypothetical protein
MKQSTLARRMTGEIALDLDELELIAEVLGVSVGQLLPGGPRADSGQTPYSARPTDRPRGGRPPNRRNGPSGRPGSVSTNDGNRRPARRSNGPSMAQLPRVA